MCTAVTLKRTSTEYINFIKFGLLESENQRFKKKNRYNVCFSVRNSVSETFAVKAMGFHFFLSLWRRWDKVKSHGELNTEIRQFEHNPCLFTRSNGGNFIKLSQNTSIPVSAHITMRLHSWGGEGRLEEGGRGGLYFQTITYNFRGLLFITWKCLLSQLKTHCSSRPALQWFLFKNYLIGWVSWVCSRGNGSNISGRHVRCVKVISWKKKKEKKKYPHALPVKYSSCFSATTPGPWCLSAL